MKPFASVSFRWLWCSSLASSGGQWMERVATAWLALESGGGPLAVGLVFAARMVPSLAFGLAAGTIADRHDRRRQVLSVGVAAVVVMLALSRLVGAGNLSFVAVTLIAFAAGCLGVFDTPARQALVMDAVPREAAPSAVAMNAFATRLFGAFGALAGGFIIPLLGVSRAYLVVAAIYAVSLVMMSAVRVPRTTEPHGARPRFARALLDAARLIVDVPAVRTLSLAGIACEVFAFSYMTAVPIVVEEILHAGPEGLGLLNASAAIGGTIAVVVLSALPTRIRSEPLLAAVYFLYGASILAFATTRSLAVAAAVLVVTGACAGAFDALEQTLIQMAVPDAQRGRAVGVWVLGLGSAPFGHLEMGIVATAIGAPSALLINGCLVLAGALTLFARAPNYRFSGVPSPFGRGSR